MTLLSRSPGTRLEARRPLRPEIQALRAIAVLMVITYHVWPAVLPGGFVGVDVFFVVSGFLITQHLLAEVERTGGVRITRFWARRVRRLLPAAFVVLAASLALALTVIPATRWVQTLREIGASAAYVQNWVLGAASIDYLAAENDPSVAQHYWSLSVEEQFYLIWPVLIVLAIIIARRFSTPEDDGRRYVSRSIAVILALVLVASFMHSVLLTASDPGIAYFSTLTRAWEFAAGGLLAVLARDVADHGDGIWRTFGSWLGLGLVALSCVVITPATPFPGAIAALPVLGTLLVLLSGAAGGRASPLRMLALRPIQWLGEVSYSAYLWHWPLVVAYPALVGRPPGARGGLLIVVVTLILAAMTKRFVEDPLRSERAVLGTRARAFAFALTGAITFASIAWAGTILVERQAAAAVDDVAQVEDCLGARSLLPGADPACLADLAGTPIVPQLAGRESDTADQYDCYVPEGGEFSSCSYGPPDADIRIAIAGDSHAASLIPGLIEVAEQRGWRLDTFVGFGCPLQPGDSCSVKDEFEAALVEGEYSAVLATSWRRFHAPADELAEYWSRLAGLGVEIVPVVDVPRVPETVDACIDASGSDRDALAACGIPLDQALGEEPDQYADGAAALGLELIDLPTLLCTSSECPTVIGGVLVYRDSPASHITSTFSRTLSWVWDERLPSIVERR